MSTSHRSDSSCVSLIRTHALSCSLPFPTEEFCSGMWHPRRWFSRRISLHLALRQFSWCCETCRWFCLLDFLADGTAVKPAASHGQSICPGQSPVAGNHVGKLDFLSYCVSSSTRDLLPHTQTGSFGGGYALAHLVTVWLFAKLFTPKLARYVLLQKSVGFLVHTTLLVLMPGIQLSIWSFEGADHVPFSLHADGSSAMLFAACSVCTQSLCSVHSGMGRCNGEANALMERLGRLCIESTPTGPATPLIVIPAGQALCRPGRSAGSCSHPEWLARCRADTAAGPQAVLPGQGSIPNGTARWQPLPLQLHS